MSAPDTVVLHKLLGINPAAVHANCINRLKDHDYIISCFASHLEADSDWPSEDHAQVQPLNRVNCWGHEEGEMVLKLKYIF